MADLSISSRLPEKLTLTSPEAQKRKIYFAQINIKCSALNSCLCTFLLSSTQYLRFLQGSLNTVAKVSNSKFPLRVQRLSWKLTAEFLYQKNTFLPWPDSSVS